MIERRILVEKVSRQEVKAGFYGK